MTKVSFHSVIWLYYAKICFHYVLQLICFYMFQTMASRDQSLSEKLSYYSDVEDQQSEGSVYSDHPTVYMNLIFHLMSRMTSVSTLTMILTKGPLRERAMRNVQGRFAQRDLALDVPSG